MTESQSAKAQTSPHSPLLAILVAVLTLVVVMIIFISASNIALGIAKKSAPLVNAAMEVKYELSLFHLWFEELVQQDPAVDREQVWQHLNRASWYANAMLQGGNNPEGRFQAVENLPLRSMIQDTLGQIARIEAAGVARLERPDASRIGSDMDHEFDAVFAEALRFADAVEAAIQSEMGAQIRRFEALVKFLGVAIVLVGLVVGVVFFHFERRRKNDYVSLLENREQLARNQATIRASEQRLFDILNTLPHGIQENDCTGIITYSNPAHHRILGWNPGELVGRHIWDFQPDAKHKQRLSEQLANLVTEQPTPEVFITRNVTRDGREVTLEVTWDYRRSAEGEVTGFISVISDITARKKVEAALRQSEEKYRLLVEHQNDLVVKVDADGRFQFASPSYCRLFGKTEEELIGRTFMPLVHPDDREMTSREMENLYRPPHTAYLEQRAMTKHGWRWLGWMDTAILDHNQQVSAIIGVGRDITDRKLTEQKLRESEDRYRAVFNQQFQFMAILSPDGTTLDINELPLRVIGCRRDDFVDKPFWRSPSWRNLPQWQEIWPKRLHQAAHTDGPVLTEDIYETASGVFRHADVATSAIRSASGDVLFFLVQASDTTKRHQAEHERSRLMWEIRQLNADLERRVQQRTEELRAANRELESFSYSVSHDLRAPLRAIDGFSLALMEDYGERLAGDGLDCLRRVRAAAQRMGLLIDDLLQLSRVSRGELQLQAVDLVDIAEAVRDELQINQSDRRVEFILGETMPVRGDPRLLRIMLDNLLGNAWKFSAQTPRPRITFKQKSDDPQVFYIQDNGVGFDMRHAGKLFGAFQRLHGVGDFPGTGVGLATVQRIVNRHGGRIWAEAQVGSGATFYFTLGSAPMRQKGK